MFDQEDDRLATPSEAVKEYARNYGSDNPDQEWVLSPFDSWERNPFYRGPRGPHPEDDHGLVEGMYDIGGLETGHETDAELEVLTAPTPKDDVPF